MQSLSTFPIFAGNPKAGEMGTAVPSEFLAVGAVKEVRERLISAALAKAHGFPWAVHAVGEGSLPTATFPLRGRWWRPRRRPL